MTPMGYMSYIILVVARDSGVAAGGMSINVIGILTILLAMYINVKTGRLPVFDIHLGRSIMTNKMLSEQRRMALMMRAGEVFSPTAPIDKRDLFAGRVQQLMKVMDVTHTRGQHAVIFGERGVGKTSLANIVMEILMATDEGSVVAVKVNCSSDDTFYTMWHKILRDVVIDEDSGKATVGFRPKPRTTQETADTGKVKESAAFKA